MAGTATTIAANNLHDEERAVIDESVEYDVATRSVSRARPPLYWALVTFSASHMARSRARSAAVVARRTPNGSLRRADVQRRDRASRRRRKTQTLPAKPDTTNRYANTFTGEFTPGAGYTIIKTNRGSLNISMYGLFRYMNQYAVGDSFTDHRGRTLAANPRNDLNWQRTFVWITGFFYDPKFRYNISLWSLPTTQQTLLFGNLQYRASQSFVFGIGITPNLTARSVQGSWPYWAATDRQMAEEFFRGGFSSGFFVTGEPIKRLQYTLSMNNNISQLGVVQSNDIPTLAYSREPPMAVRRPATRSSSVHSRTMRSSTDSPSSTPRRRWREIPGQLFCGGILLAHVG